MKNHRLVNILPLALAIFALPAIAPAADTAATDNSAASTTASDSNTTSASSSADTKTFADAMKAQKGGDTSYRLHPRDELTITCLDDSRVTNKYKIALDGTITLPYLDTPINISGLTINDAIKKIAETYVKEQIFINPQLTIVIEDYASQRINMNGQFSRPGPVEIPPEEKLSLYEAVTMAGGWTRDASIYVTITRKNPDGTTTTMKDVNLRAIVEGKAKDIPLQDGDSVFIGESWTGASWQ
jgi:protein involved in polysaccharide export with SLBB domain